MLITTSRKPGQLTRAVARTLSQVLGGRFENRGKASFDQIAAKAEKGGHSRILFLWEKNGNPDRLVVFDLEKAVLADAAKKPFDSENGPWLQPELLISGVVFPRLAFRAQGCRLRSDGVEGKKAAALFQVAEGENQMVISEKSLNAFNENRLVLSLRFKWGPSAP